MQWANIDWLKTYRSPDSRCQNVARSYFSVTRSRVGLASFRVCRYIPYPRKGRSTKPCHLLRHSHKLLRPFSTFNPVCLTQLALEKAPIMPRYSCLLSALFASSLLIGASNPALARGGPGGGGVRVGVAVGGPAVRGGVVVGSRGGYHAPPHYHGGYPYPRYGYRGYGYGVGLGVGLGLGAAYAYPGYGI